MLVLWRCGGPLLVCAGLIGCGSDDDSGSGDGDAGGSSGGSITGSGAGSTGGSGSSTGGSGSSTGGSGSGTAGNSSDPYAEARQACVDRINGFRATEGLPPYERWTSAEACTDGQAQSDSVTGDAHGEFGACDENAQNECPGWGSVDQIIEGCLQDMWDEGPGPFDEGHGHYLNMSSTDYTMVACGFFETADGEVWAIQNFR